MKNFDIDIIIPWVDGNDPEWQQVFAKYSGKTDAKDDNSICKYRDWDNLQYLFRGIEKFAPWVRTVHFVTCGQKPKWLNISAPKLHFVSHKDFIPCEWLPTFSVRPIELNIHRIEGLAERFIYFNDDFFLLRPVGIDRFFRNELPCDIASFEAIQPETPREHVILNNVSVINKHFNKKEVLHDYRWKWFRCDNLSALYRNLALTPWTFFTGFKSTHLPQPFLKSTYQKVWESEEKLLKETSSHRFRDITDVNQSLFRYWQMVSGNFSPKNVIKDTRIALINDKNASNVAETIANQAVDILVMNDSNNISKFENTKKSINKAFQAILPEKSSFEI